MKIISLRQEVDVQNEIELLNLCQGHANIVKLHEVYSDEVSFIPMIPRVKSNTHTLMCDPPNDVLQQVSSF